MDIQPTKCGIMHVGNKNPKTDYTFNGETLPVISSVRDLGVEITDKLSFEKHIEKIIKSANVKSNMIHRTFKNKTPSFMMQMFNTFVRSKLEYASQIWSPHHINLINRIESVQRRFTKRILILSILNLPFINNCNFLKILHKTRKLSCTYSLICIYN